MTTDQPQLRPLHARDVDACEAILRALPEWFGIEQSILGYRRELERLEGFVAEDDGGVSGFLAIQPYGAHAADIHVMAVCADRHRHGVGRALVARVERDLRERGFDFLQVKTLGPSRPNDAYARTREFYRSVGFLPLEETLLWGPVNPCLIMIKHLRCVER
jgi:GNAT superfamily N-acetyltransferase